MRARCQRLAIEASMIALAADTRARPRARREVARYSFFLFDQSVMAVTDFSFSPSLPSRVGSNEQIFGADEQILGAIRATKGRHTPPRPGGIGIFWTRGTPGSGAPTHGCSGHRWHNPRNCWHSHQRFNVQEALVRNALLAGMALSTGAERQQESAFL